MTYRKYCHYLKYPQLSYVYILLGVEFIIKDLGNIRSETPIWGHKGKKFEHQELVKSLYQS